MALGVVRRQLGSGQLQEAYEGAMRLIDKDKKDAEAHFLVGLIAEQTGQDEIARKHGARSLAVREHADTVFLLSRLERRGGNTDRAIELCDRALTLHPGSVPLLIHRAGTLEEAGRVSEARAVVDPLVDSLRSRGTVLPAALRFELGKLLVQERSYEDAAVLIDEVVEESSTPDELRRLAYYLQAKALDRSGQFDRAFEAARMANEVGMLEFDPKLYEEQVSTLIEQWSADRIARFPVSSCEEELPVFVAGMPRSGTSLIDQIIDAHPSASGVGELSSLERFAQQLSEVYDSDLEPPRCFGRFDRFRWTRVARDYVSSVRKLAPDGTTRVVNKALGNNKLVGLLACLFPKTRIIHALRDPRDVAVSCYMGGFNNRLHPWTTKLEWVAAAWEQSARMMEHWKTVLDVPIYEVRYESLVSDPEKEIPGLIAFLGLEWDPACLEFHRSKRTVRTLSYDQVNRPLYTSSAGRHVNYNEQLASVRFPAYPR